MTDFVDPYLDPATGLLRNLVAEQLHADNNLKGMSRDQFIERLAHHYDELNYLHPFREGNGRTQRVFWSRIARDAGWQLDWRPIQGGVNDAACRIAQEAQDLGPLREMFDRVVTVGISSNERDAEWREAEPHRLGLDQNRPSRLSTPNEQRRT